MKRRKLIHALQTVDRSKAEVPNFPTRGSGGDKEALGGNSRDEMSGSEWHDGFTSNAEHSFTMAAVNDLISQAEVQARLQDGRSLADRLEASQEKTRRAREKVMAFFGSLPSGARLQDLGPLLMDLLNIFGFDGSRPLSSCSKRSIFPLPAPEDPGDLPGRFSFLQAVIEALNSYHGCETIHRFNPVSSKAEKRMAAVVRESSCLGEPLVDESFDSFFPNRGLDYEGDEVKLAREITWEGIEASLPDEVGKLDIRHFCEGGFCAISTTSRTFSSLNSCKQ